MRADEPSIKRGREIGVLAFLVLATFLVYLPTAGFEFTTYDDPLYFTANEEVLRGLTRDGWRWAWTTNHATNWHPLTWLSHMLDVELFGPSSRGAHLVNALLHAGSAAFLFAFLFRTTGFLWRSTLVTALFAFHPMRVESVAWVAERKDVLSAFWTLATLFAYAEFARRRTVVSSAMTPVSAAAPSSVLYGVALGSAALAMLAKPMAVTIPFLLVLLDVWPLERIKGNWASALRRASVGNARSHPVRAGTPPLTHRQLFIEKIPFLVLAVACAAATWAVQYRGGAMQAGVTIPFGDRLVNAVVSCAWYVWKLVVPSNLSPLYIHPSLPGGTPWAAWQIAAALVFLVMVSVLVFRARSRRYPVVGWLWYLGMLVPVIGLVQVGGQAAADRYTYLPSIGLLLLVVWSVSDVMQGVWARTARTPRTPDEKGRASDPKDPAVDHKDSGVDPKDLTSGPKDRTLDRKERASMRNERPSDRNARSLPHGIVTAAIVVCVGAWALSWKQVHVWQNSETLYRHALGVNPNNMLMHNNLALVLYTKGEVAEAETHFREALRILPTYRQAVEGLAQLLTERGANAEAIDLLRTATRLRPGRASGNDADPNRARILLNLGRLLLTEGRREEASSVLAEISAIDPGLASIEDERGQQLESEGKRDAARLAYECALAIDAQHPEASYHLGNLLVQQGSLSEAIAHYENALRRRPDLAVARNNLGWALLQLERAREARPHLEEALRIQPGWELPLRSLAWILATDPDPARRDAVRAIALAEEALRKAKPPTPSHYEALAAACAANGEMKRANEVVETALRLAPAGSAVEARLQEQQSLYRIGRPYLVNEPAEAGRSETQP